VAAALLLAAGLSPVTRISVPGLFVAGHGRRYNFLDLTPVLSNPQDRQVEATQALLRLRDVDRSYSSRDVDDHDNSVSA
jgi:hypothetical protein